MRSSQRPPLKYPYEYVCVYDLETIVDEEMPDGSFPPWPRHRPVAGAFLTAEWSPVGYSFKFDTLLCREGREAEFYRKIDSLLPSGGMGVSLNGRNFDNAVLRLQAQRNGLFDLRNIARQSESGRFDVAHLDLMDAFGGGRGTSLAELCGALDIPVKTSVTGGDVAGLWKLGNLAAIKAYVQEDVIATYILHLHAAAWREGHERQLVLPLADLAAWIEGEPGLRHLLPFATCRPAKWARSRAPALRAAAALADAELRLKREQDEAAFSSR
ncbi:hypothetical protein sphantq_00979 [Sphingobium sp. AntQ-1]|uniref:hypothetical protein n=1 Tax=Sphingobium sp. AntQ-1 TaxID=2930091 RepID=UPI00234FA213|nr:hypothetical protein [Sphingobium sp. AntQ-1]WCP12579.1 hypothetical protein sphantq_00979 [Sphingobium sp. AntQ-1]